MNMKYRLVFALLLTIWLAGGDAAAQSSGSGIVINGSVYGGGNLADVGGNVTVNMRTGTVANDVYGGGALANTNNYNPDGYTDVTEQLTEGVSVVTGLYTESGGVYTEIITANETADGSKTYYKKGKWENTVTNNTTTVNLTGGTINGDAYGGGLGRIGVTAVEGVHYTQSECNEYNTANSLQEGDDGYRTTTNCWKTEPVEGVDEVKATVYGNINVYLGKTDGSSATKFIISEYSDGHSDVVKSGRVFGCNNLNGSPQGNVTVTVYTTVTGNRGKTPAGTDGKAPKTVSSATIYRVAAVYGGGNLANYEPTATNKKSHVIIYGCDETSIGYVYGGGNAAAVPETAVDIYAAYEIGYVFGGGNGKDEYTLDGSTWKTNPGANVNGNANTMLYGGTIHEAFGGSNEKGTISGSVYINTDDTNAGCDLDVGKLYGAGKNADIEGDLKIILGCKTKRTEEVYGGAENANVKGNVELTITSGEFGKVFGGNNQSGAIFGHIILNIEETGCRPIIIDELYLGGYQAAYSVYGYYKGQCYQNAGNYYLDADHTIPLYQNDGKLYLDAEKTKRLYPKTEEGHNYLYLDEEYQKPLYRPRTSTSDGTAVTFTGLPNTNPNATSAGQYDNPELNIISCTRIGKVFGGGLGEGAVIYGSPTVNINQMLGIKEDANNSGTYVAATELGQIGVNANGTTTDCGVFGGGNQAKVVGNTTVNIGTKTTVDLHQSVNASGVYTMDEDKPVLGANILSNVYGGGNLADVTEKTQVNICAAYNSTTKKWESVDEGTKKVNIAGNVYGGGKGVAKEEYDAGAFFCAEAMVGVNNTNSAANNNSSTYADNGTHVRIGHGTVGTLNAGTLVDGTGNVYGGGEIGRVEFHTEVIIGLGTATGETTKSPVILGSVFGAGKGANTHGYSGLVRGDSRVTVQAAAKVGHSVYGGGEMASVGKYELDSYGLPKTPLWGGKCTVTIQDYAEIGPDGMLMKNTTTGKPDDTGHVFGAGKGTLPYENVTGSPWSMELSGKVIYDEEHYVKGNDGLEYDAAYYKFIQSLGLASNTDVTIGGHAFVKGSVYGGSENGYLQANSHVTIAGGQIGEGLGETTPYADNAFIDPSTTTVTTGLAACATWDYDKGTTGKPYDKYATHLNPTDNEYYYDDGFTKSSKGGAPVATDGHTYYGNVFGGGRGVVPFDAGKWHRAAGSVAGNTRVDITGGHILSSVYGGNEQTDVGSYEMDNGEPTTTLESGGTCTINMSGGTVGVPRTQQQIENNPVIGNVFGAGKGDKRVLFNTWTNVGTTSVNISGTARIYGSVFGGGEDGHVIGNAVSSIGGTFTIGTTSVSHSNVVIGSTGISGADGNVFGGGRGSETALTAGVVGGNVTLTVNNGKILGSVYGGGRLASVGTNFVNPYQTDKDGNIVTDAESGEPVPHPDYGKMQSGDTHGHVTVNINGGYIGTETATGVNGNIFGASKGTVTDFDLGIVKSTKITMTGGTAYASVYGGGELAQVVESHTTNNKTLGTEINISGGTIGISGQGQAIWGNVFGGGKGNTTDLDAGLVKTNTSIIIQNGSTTVNGTTTTTTPTIYHNIYGGGAYGSVGTITRNDNVDYVIGEASVTDMPTAWATNTGLAEITILGGTIGVDGKENGMVFGSSRGDVGAPGANHDKLAWVKDTKVVIGASSTDGPTIYGSVYGSGENGHTFHDTDVKVHSGIIGVNNNQTVTYKDDPDDANKETYKGKDYNYPYRGNVYGGGCGTDTYDVVVNAGAENEKTYKKYNPLAGIVLGDANVTIDGGNVVHNVYGAGAMGSVGTIDNDLIVTHNSHTTDGKESYYDFGLSWPVKFVYKEDADEELTGKTTVTIKGSAIIGVTNSDAKGGHIFGAARGAVDVGQTDISDQRYEEAKLANVREAKVVIGTDGGSGDNPTIHGSVYGGGEDGHVNEDANIIIHHGTIAHSVFGAGKGESTYKTKLWSAANTPKDTEEAVYSWTAGKVYGNTTVTMNGGSVGYNIYGGGNLASVGKGNYSGGSDDYSEDGYGELPQKNGNANGPLWTANPADGSSAYYFANSGIATVNIYAGSVGKNLANDTEDGTATGFPRGNVFGSSRGVAAPSGSQSPRYRYKPDFFLGYVNKTVVNIGNSSGGPNIYGSVYGGGQDGHVRNSANVTITKGNIGRNGDSNIERGNVFGAGSGTGKYDSDGDANHTPDACNYSSGSVSCTTQVDIEGGTIYRNVYGGGALASVGPPFTGVQMLNGLPYDEVKTAAGGKLSVSYSKVNIRGGAISGSVYGASRGPSQELLNTVFAATDSIADPDHYYDKKKFATVIWSDVNVTGGANISGSVYGGGEKGIVKHATEVNIGTTGTGGVAYTGTIAGSVYGGGQEAMVGGNVTVNMNSGTVNKDVYGGGALANTNINTHELITVVSRNEEVTANATGAKNTAEEIGGLTTVVNLLGGAVKGDAYGGGLGRLAKAAVAGTKFTQEEIDAAQEGDDAYGKTTGDWKVEPVAAVTAIPATVYGDITVQLGDDTRDSQTNEFTPVNATKFYITKYTGTDIVKSGRIFGCNNLNGSPQGNVTVDVFKTEEGSTKRTAITRGQDGKIATKAEPSTYEVAAVYGGGNLANYAPTATGKKTSVIIETCDVSIETVYGGGNAADVPGTDVLVKGAHEINEVFGGGNGQDDYTLDNGATWNTNEGADVNGNAITLLKGGFIHEAYGGSNSKGTISGNVSITKDSGGACPLEVSEVYGAGKNADVEGDLILVMGCSESRTEAIYGCSKNANVKGNVELTITSGEYGKVFGGNNESGAIFGHIKVNIEEVGCSPIIIDELYGCGNDAAYSVYGYYKGQYYQKDGNYYLDAAFTIPLYQNDGKLYLDAEKTQRLYPKTEEGHNYLYLDAEYQKPLYRPRTSASDGTAVTFTGKPHTDPNATSAGQYDDPEVNIISCTRIGKVFGGGYGTGATVYGNPKVNINMIKGAWANRTYGSVTYLDALGKVGDGYQYTDETTNEPVQDKGGVFGGGNKAPVYGNTNVNIGTVTDVYVVKTGITTGTSVKDYYTLNEGSYTPMSDDDEAEEGVYYYEKKTVLGANVTGNVYGGGNLADVGKTELKKDANNKDYDDIKMHGYTYVNIGAVLGSGNNTDGYNYTAVDLKTSAGNDYEGITIEGNVFGGGKGEAAESGNGAFRCGKAMVTGGTNVCIANGTVKRITRTDGTLTGSVYGGGEVGRVEENSRVTIGVGNGVTTGTPTIVPIIESNVFGGGKGVKTHGYAALLRGNTYVTVQADAKIGRSVYGGGEIASVGKYNVADAAYHTLHPEVEEGMPYSLGNENSGYCNVIVRGNAEIGPDNMKMYYANGTPPDDEGHVFGAGKGILPYEDVDLEHGEKPGRMTPGNTMEYYTSTDYTGSGSYEDAYLRFIESQALATHTEVLVDGNAFVKGSVYGGSLSGHVQHDTHVTIDGDCQIGAGDGINKRYTEYYNSEWPTDNITQSWAACAHWIFDASDDAPYDPYAKYEIDGKYYYADYEDHPENYYKDSKGNYYFDAEHKEPLYANGGSCIAKDGHTYYGNVFGGGSGVVPYAPGKWHREAGTVGGNTVVDIKGGHILTSVYGGNEHTDVGTYDRSHNNRVLLANTGSCTINMIGGTVGVPRLSPDIKAHPVISCVYGAGKGDSRTNFNEWTNVGETHVNISGNARIYCSIFGGGEDGHVLGNAITNIGGTVTIGTTSKSHENVIIGSQGQSGADGNVFGGGRGFSEDALTAGVVCGDVTLNIKNGKMLGTVYGGGRLASVGTHLDDKDGTYYGKLIPDGKNQVIGGDDVDATGATHGHIAINIDGGTIGATDAQGKLLTSSSSIGDVFGACKGAGSDTRFGLAKHTTITMTAGTVNGSIYGGGELGNVSDNTEVDIQGGTIAKNVFGGGKGSEDLFTCEQAMVGVEGDGACQDPDVAVNQNKGTIVTISNGTVGTLNNQTLVQGTGNVYGGGEIGRVEWNTQVKIGIGTDETDEGPFAPVIYGSVFGAGKGLETHGYSALVRGNSTVTVQGKAKVGYNVYGGGEKSTVGRYWVKDIPATPCGEDETQPTAPAGLPTGMPYQQRSGGKCRVYIQGEAEIGYNGADDDKGHVFGAGKGVNPHFTAETTERMVNNNNGGSMQAFEDEKDQTGTVVKTAEELYLEFLQTLALVTNAYVTIDGSAKVKGNVYGGSESGFVQHDTNVTIQGSNCVIGTVNGTTSSYGNVFGGGKGLDTFAEAGKVKGNTTVAISNGTMNGNVYGGGQLGDVGIIDKTDKDNNGNLTYNYYWKQTDGTTANTAEYNKPSDESHDTSKNTGICTVTITGGTIGSASASTANHASGHVFGAGKGLENTWWCEKAIAYATNVSVSDGTVVYGNVYGGGQVGRVEDDAQVTIGEEDESGEGSHPDIKGDIYGAGAGLETHGYSALVRGNAKVTVQGIAKVGGKVYGGGETASVGKFEVVKGLPSRPLTGGTCTVTIQDNAKIGTSGTDHNVFGACKGVKSMYNQTNYKNFKSMQTVANGAIGTQGTDWDYYTDDHRFVWKYYTSEAAYLEFLKTLALTSNTNVTIDENSTVNGSVYGGGERGVTLGTVVVNMNGGTVNKDVYGGGALADTNTGNWDVHAYVVANVSEGASVDGLYIDTGTTDTNGHPIYAVTTDVTAQSSTTYYRHTWADANRKSALYTTTVNLHHGTIGGTAFGGGLGSKPTANNLTAANIAALVYGNVFVELNKNDDDDCKVLKIHGCNNYNGSPKGDVKVYVHKTVAYGDGIHLKSAEKHDTTYDMDAVYGGGNEAEYDPEDASTHKTEVFIDGCTLTSIKTVYGGGNAAAAPATHVVVNSCYEIGKVFAGGNGLDDLDDDTPNFGAHVGYHAAYQYDYTKTREQNIAAAAAAFEAQKANLEYGTGEALAELWGGTIHSAFGGSNTLGNVRTSATVTLDEADPEGCALCIEEVYGAGNEADQDGTSNINLGCISYLSEIYGGAKNADINNNIELNIQSGRFNRVFGGNNLGGNISGTITVNIEETGCHPIVIGQLFGGGNQAAYTAPTGKPGPTVNVKSFTSIGEIYGGGFGNSAEVTGDTYININEYKGKYADERATVDFTDENGNPVTENGVPVKVSENTGKWIHFVADASNSNNIATVWQPEHREGAIGTIGNVFGGGNEAGVTGSTNVRIGNMSYVPIASVVAGTTDVRGYYTRSGEGTTESPYVYTQVPAENNPTLVPAVANTTYYSLNDDTYEEVDEDDITVGETDVRDYYIRSGDNTEASPYVYTKVPILAGGTTYYKLVLGANITGNVYGGGNAANVSGDTNVVIGREP